MRGVLVRGRTLAVCLSVFGLSLFAAPAFGQGLGTVEPTLAECEAFVADNGVPAERPVAPNRGYSGYDICLNMAYDGDLPGYFAGADASGDGVLQAGEQRAYLDTVIGPVSDPDQTGLTVEKCQALVSEYGIPAERPFVDWGNRGYGEVDVCQALAYDGDLAGGFAAWDSNADGRLDRSETNALVGSYGEGDAATEAETPERTPSVAAGSGRQNENSAEGPTSGQGAAGSGAGQAEGETGEVESGGTYGEATIPSGSAAVSEQYEQYGEATGAVAPNQEAEATIPAYSEDAGEETTGSEETDEDTASSGGEQQAGASGEENAEPQQGVLSAVSSFVDSVLPSTGGVALLGIAGGVVLIGGGLLAYRFLS